MKERLKPLLYSVLSHPPVKQCLEAIPYASRVLPSYHRTHPFDRQYGIDTSGVVPVEMITSDKILSRKINPYGASQPSIIRRAITALGAVDDYEFIDLGCGKGRAMVVASEFPFLRISGIELSPDLTKVARRNIATLQRDFPARPPVEAVEGNAITFPFPKAKLVLFFCHSFGEELLSQLIGNLEAAISSGIGPIFFVYYNPVHGNVLDNSPAFARFFADTLPYDKRELGFGPDSEDTIVIWRSRGRTTMASHPHADRSIIITKPLWRADLAGSSTRRASADATGRSE
jgi:SAM-dependent methyltransferase